MEKKQKQTNKKNCTNPSFLPVQMQIDLLPRLQADTKFLHSPFTCEGNVNPPLVSDVVVASDSFCVCVRTYLTLCGIFRDMDVSATFCCGRCDLAPFREAVQHWRNVFVK